MNFKITPKRKGYALILGSAAALSVTFVASKQALNELSPLAFAPTWFALASIWGLIYYSFQPQKTSVRHLKPFLLPLIFLGFSAAIGNYLFFSAIELGNPTVVAFFARSETLFSLLWGVLLLGERLNRMQWAGSFIAISGALVMTYNGTDVIWLVLALAVAANFFHSLTSFVAKRNVNQISYILLGIARTVGASAVLFIIALALNEFRLPSLVTLLWMIGGSFFGPFLSFQLYYKGLEVIDMGQAAIIRATQPLFVAVYSLILFGDLLRPQEMIGGLIILVGITMLLYFRHRRLPQPSTVTG